MAAVPIDRVARCYCEAVEIQVKGMVPTPVQQMPDCAVSGCTKMCTKPHARTNSVPR